MDLKVDKEFLVGSQYFFKEYDDYVVHDLDKLCILLSGLQHNKTFVWKKKKEDILFCPKMTKDKYIKTDLKSNQPIKVGKYLIPEFAEYIGLTIDDLSKVKPLIDNLDEKHKYEKVIYDAYIENNAFKLTDKQRDEAYEEYKRARQ